MILNFSFSMLLVVLIVTPVLLLIFRAAALKYGLVDKPNSRKIHGEPVALIGGLVLFVMAVILLLMTQSITEFGFYLILASGFVVLVGFMDDLFGLSALWRFIVQILASLLIIYFTNIRLDAFGHLILPNWDIQLGLLSIPVTIFGVVGIINALNMADGIDGLAAMTFISPVLVLSFLSGYNSLSIWLMFFVLSLLIFVGFNKSNKQKIFLGDSGSLLLGFILAWLLVYFSQGAAAVVLPVTALYLVALPLYDTIFVMMKRIFSGQSPFQPDKTHLHHLFLSFGFSQSKTLLAMITMQLLFIGLGVLFLKIDLAEHFQFYCFVLLSVVYCLFINKLWSLQTDRVGLVYE